MNFTKNSSSRKTTDHNSWDPLVRIIHWSVAGLFIVNYFFTEHGYALHQNIGWAILGLVVVRILWGVTLARGPNRLTSFIPSLAGAREHLVELKSRSTPANTGHNAFGAVAIYLFWVGLIAAAVTGWLQDTDWGFERDVGDWHEWIVEALWILVIVHISAVVMTSLWLRKNLILQMIRG